MKIDIYDILCGFILLTSIIIILSQPILYYLLAMKFKYIFIDNKDKKKILKIQNSSIPVIENFLHKKKFININNIFIKRTWGIYNNIILDKKNNTIEAWWEFRKGIFKGKYKVTDNYIGNPATYLRKILKKIIKIDTKNKK